MKKVLSYILISVILLANFFAPISVLWNEKNNVEIKRNEVLAETQEDFILLTKIYVNDTTVKLGVEWEFTKETSLKLQNYSNLTLIVGIVNSEGQTIRPVQTEDILSNENDNIILNNDYRFSFEELPPETSLIIEAKINGIINGIEGTLVSISKEIQTKEKDATDLIKQESIRSDSNESFLPACSFMNPFKEGSFPGCIAQGIYYILFIPTSFFFAIAGTFFDWTFNYSVQSSSYSNPFVVQGWNITRDLCNMFFIFILLYIAFGTILNLNKVKTKEMIINVVIIGLLINFSLFATRIIIDASNILARVFYNSNTIIITEVDNDLNIPNMVKKPTESGIIPLSEALVNKVNPQSLIINAKKVGDIGDKAGQTNENETSKGNVTTRVFIIVTLLASGINIVGFIVFLTVGMLFVVRVVGLWLAMILAPFAFFSYTVPEMQNWGTVGWKKWWPETFSLAFLAPVFIFFIYLILKFLQIGLGVLNVDGGGGTLSFVISVVVPFAFIMVLLMKAKKIAVKMSGEMGESVSKFGSTVGGLALGAGVGLGAMAMRGSLGALGSKIDKSGWINNMAGSENKFTSMLGNKLKNTGQYIGKSSFDVRNTKLGANINKGLDTDLGKGKTGGYEKDRKDKVEKKQKRAEELKVHQDEEMNQKIMKEEVALQQVLNSVVEDFDLIDKKLEIQRQIKKDTNMNSTENRAAVTEIKKLVDLKTALKKIDGTAASEADAVNKALALTDVTGILQARFSTAASTLNRSVISNGGVSINEREANIIPDLKKQKATEDRRRATNYANNQLAWMGDSWWRGGDTNREAQHKIIMGNKIDSGTKT